MGWLLLSAGIAFVGIALFPLALPNLGRNRGLAAGQERVPEDEALHIATLVRGIEAIQRTEFSQKRATAPDAKALRDAHAKAHGCVKATFTVAKELPPELALGLFAEPRSYPAWVRFSNSDRHPASDLKKDGRGMAIKLMGVPGAKLLDDELDATTHDFVMINHPVFFVRNAADYVDFIDAQARNSDLGFFVGARPPWRWRLHELWSGTRIKGHDVRSPFEERYFSMSAYALGDRAVKFSARPCVGGPITPVPAGGADALREMMVSTLAQESVCFDFQLQLQGDPHDMPVEDPTIEWSEQASPFRTVARLEIPPQTLVENDQTCENLSFTPWHALPAHRPLGGINRVRKAVYAAISRWRHGENRTERKEP